jgi:hypothetical protein
MQADPCRLRKRLNPLRVSGSLDKKGDEDASFYKAKGGIFSPPPFFVKQTLHNTVY